MVDYTLVLQLPNEVFLHIIKIGSIWSEADEALVSIKCEISFINVINSKELVLELYHTTPFLELQNIFVCEQCSHEVHLLTGPQIMKVFLTSLRALNHFLRLGATNIIKALNIVRTWVTTTIGEDA